MRVREGFEVNLCNRDEDKEDLKGQENDLLYLMMCKRDGEKVEESKMRNITKDIE